MRRVGGSLRAPSRVTLRRVAESAGVSLATASRAVNGQPGVAPQTRERIEQAAREEGYPLAGASLLDERSTRLVGVTMPYAAPTYFAAVLQGTAEALYEHQMRVVLCPTRHQHDREVSLIDYLSHGATDGALLVLPEQSNSELAALGRLGYPFVVVDPLQALAPGIASVSAANTAVGAQATSHLVALGHRRVAAITGPSHFLATEGRLRGYYATLAAAGVGPDRSLVVEADFEFAGGRLAGERLLALSDPPSAIFAFNDKMAIGVLAAARARGIRVPEELSVVGVDDTPEAELAVPPLTTVRQPLAEMGRMGVNLLLRMLEHHEHEPLHVELETSLVVRASTGPLAGRGQPSRS
jgi:LacI family transcriptional regulator